MQKRTTCVLAALLALSSAAHATGYQTALLPDPGHPPLFVAIWYPSAAPATPTRIADDSVLVARNGPIQGDGLKLIVMSPGLGGNFAGNLDTALALAGAGFVVAALTHTNDTPQSGLQMLKLWDRTRQLHAVTDWVLQAWQGHPHLDPCHIGVFGFSAGGLTALVAAGGTPDLALLAPHCRKYPAEFTCAIIAQANPEHARLPDPPPGAWVHDTRIHAAVIAAPALGFSFGKSGLAALRVPVQLWRAANDETLPQPFYAQAVADDLPARPDYHVVSRARHLDFLSPCTTTKAAAAPAICTSLPNFDRAAFHREFNRDVVAFFAAHLGVPEK